MQPARLAGGCACGAARGLPAEVPAAARRLEQAGGERMPPWAQSASRRAGPRTSPAGAVRVVRGSGLDQLVFYLPDAAAREQMQAGLAAAGARPVAQIAYWQANGGVTCQDPDGREGVFASWIYLPPGSLSARAR